MAHYLWWFMQVAVIAAAVLLPTALILFLIRSARRRQGTPLNPLNPYHLLFDTLLAGDVLITLLLTLVARRTSGDVAIRLQLLASWREAWNAWSPPLFEQLFLNIAVFAPFGALIALRFSRLRRTWAYGGLSFFFSLLIELLQLLTRRGVFDVDDLLGNTVGGILGGTLCCFILSLTEKKPLRALGASLPLLLFAGACFAFFGAYHAQPYGNLAIAPNKTYAMRGTEVRTAIDLTDTPDSAVIYRETEFAEDTCMAAAAQILDALGLVTEDAQIEYFPAQITFDYPHEGIYLNYSRAGGTWYLVHLADGTHPAPAISTKSELTDWLTAFGADLRNTEVFHAGRQSWRIRPSGGRAPIGETVCTFHADGGWSIDAGLPHLTPCEEKPILTPAEVLRQIKEGHFRLIGESAFPAEHLTLTALNLTYRTDTKGFYQPVWQITAEIDGISHNLLIPACK